MQLDIQKNQFPNLVEIWITGENTVEVYTQKGNHYRITAKENIKSGSTVDYSAGYEYLKEVKLVNVKFEVWTPDYSLPSQDVATIERCLTPAISWVNERR